MNLITNELRRGGRHVEIQEQPLRTIALLAQRAGELVTREELQQRLWPGDTFVDFEAGLKSIIWKARHALGDGAANPRYIETVPRQGYRFIAPVTFEMAGQVPEKPMTLTLAPSPASSPPPVVEAAPPAAADAPIQTVVPPSDSRPFTIAVALACIALLVGAGVLIWNRTRPTAPVLDRMRPFANAHGHQSRPAFSPNGEILAFDWKGPADQHSCVYLQRLDSATASRLTPGLFEESRPIWSKDGSTIAFLRNLSADQYAIVTVPVVGKGERVWTVFRKGAAGWYDWSDDGKWFAFAEPAIPNRPPSIVIMALATGEKRVLTAPPEFWRGDSEPAFSPDSTQVAFRRTMPRSGSEDIYIVPLTGGELKRITFDSRTISALSFTPDGGLLFSSARAASNRSLWWSPPGGGPLTRVTPDTEDVVTPAVSRDGKHFAFSKIQLDLNIWRVDVDGSERAAPLIASELSDSSPNYSPDGRRILFQSSRTGSSEIWACDVSGADAVRLTDSRGAPINSPKWSPDGRRNAFEWQPSGKAGIYVMASDGGSTRAVVSDNVQNANPFWSADGRSLYFASARTGRFEIWKTSVEGGSLVQITQNGGMNPQLSPDGQFLYYFHDSKVWRVPLVGGMPSGPESKMSVPFTAGDWGNWVPTNDGLYFMRRADMGGNAIEFLDFAQGQIRLIHEMPKSPMYGGNGLALSPDGKSLLFVEVDQDDSSIFVQ